MKSKKSKIGIITFPGTNCDRDMAHFIEAKLFEAVPLWHLDQFSIKDYNALVLPGGFSYGDYLRSGALAARSPVMKSVKEFVDFGGPVLGVCNGFQILTEAGLLPGALTRNRGLNFIDDWSTLEVINSSPAWGGDKVSVSRRLRLPIAHGDGCYYTDSESLKKIQDNEQIWLRYCENPNGSLDNIAGVLSPNKKVAGLMPHPERALYDWMGGIDGWEFI